MCHHTTARLPCSPSAVRMARSFVATELDEWGATATDLAYEGVQDAVLVTSELVANAVRFCAQEIVLRLEVHRRFVEIAVTDDHPSLAQLQHPNPSHPRGRGLLLVDALSERWGQFRDGAKKTVWARLTLPQGSAVARGCTWLDP